jgi:Zn-dependent M28 family amino/carboxypeptidase
MPIGLIRVRDSLLHGKSRLELKVRTKSYTDFPSRNVMASVPGTRRPDSLLVLTAHYDHLGRMGKAIYPGANDNASGVALLLDLAAEIAKKPLPYTTVFVFFAGEEAGLLGSEAMVRDKKLPLSHIRFLLNLDLMGSGETGMTAVNATVFQQEFALMDSLNRRFKYLPEIRKRGKAANSDHHYFTEAGVPSFFWYLSGPRSAYHDVYDVPSTLTLHGYNATFRLVMSFFESLSSAQ